MPGRAFTLLLPLVTLMAADHGFGPLPPTPVPAVAVTDQDGIERPLTEVVRGKAVAVQFIFSSCATACPLLGSTFSTIQKKMRGEPDGWMLLSISVDPDHDSPVELKKWLARQRAGPKWLAVSSSKSAIVDILSAFKQKPGPIINHRAQVFFINKRGDIVSRTTPLPDADAVARELTTRAR